LFSEGAQWKLSSGGKAMSIQVTPVSMGGKAARITINTELLSPVDQNAFVQGSVVRAFVRTDNNNPWVLATLNETQNNPDTAGAIFASPRQLGGDQGVLVTINYINSQSYGEIVFTVFQHGASNYFEPIPWPKGQR
jgi:hypothetical protein